MGRLDADTIVRLRQLPDVGYNIERTYKFRDLSYTKNAIGYSDPIYRTNYPCLEARLSDFFFNRNCDRDDFQSFVYEFKAKRQPFLFLDLFNCTLKENQNKQIESYTTLELITSTKYYLYQNYKYGLISIKKPIHHYKITSLINNNTLVSVPDTILSGVLDLGINFTNYKISGEFYTPVKIKDGIETETVNKSLRTLNDLSLYEYPIKIYTSKYISYND